MRKEQIDEPEVDTAAAGSAEPLSRRCRRAEPRGGTGSHRRVITVSWTDPEENRYA